MPALAIIALLALLLLVGRSSMTGATKTSQQGRAELIRHEGIRYEPYRDVAGFWTVGIGHLVVPGDGVPRGVNGEPLPVDETFLITLFETDLAHAENAVNRNVTVPLTQGQFDALTDFVFNLGEARFKGSTLLQHLNAGNYPAAAEEFKKWIYAGGSQVPGLVARRADNYRTFLA